MRDIRKDLKERIDNLDSQKEHFRLRLKKLEEKEGALQTLLEQEEADWQARQPTLLDFGGASAPVKTRSELGKFILTALADGNPHRIDDLIIAVQRQNIPIKGKYPRRAVHFSLVGMKQNNLVEMVESGVWKKHTNGNSETSH